MLCHHVDAKMKPGPSGGRASALTHSSALIANFFEMFSLIFISGVLPACVSVRVLGPLEL